MFSRRHLLLVFSPVNMHASQLRLNRADPLLLFMRLGVTKHQVHVLERLTTSLWDEEVCKCESQQTEGREEDVRPPSDGLEHVRSHEADDEIRHPGAGGGD